jgi:hypothetical protein
MVHRAGFGDPLWAVAKDLNEDEHQLTTAKNRTDTGHEFLRAATEFWPDPFSDKFLRTRQHNASDDPFSV